MDETKGRAKSRIGRRNADVERRKVLKGAAALGAVAAVGGFPAVLRAQSQGAIKVGMPTILSGRVAIVGETSSAGAMMVISKFNDAGGLNGRKIELVVRDSKGRPDEAARVTRELVNSDGCEIILDAEASSGAFAVHEVIRDLGVFCIHTNSETSSLTADPKLHVPTAFRSARQGIHDAIGGGEYAANVAKAKGLKKWMTVSPDYAYGRSNTAEFMEYAKFFHPAIELVDQSWPKLFQPDYTEVITKVLQVRPQAIYSALWGGDLAAFTDQAALYSLYSQFEAFCVNMGDYPVLTAIKNLPKGVHSGGRYNRTVPDTPENQAWYEEYTKANSHLPTNWSWENDTGARFMIEALMKAGTTDGKKMAEALKGATVKSPFGVNGTLTMRGEDHTIVDYVVGYGISTQEDPYITNFKTSSWDKIYELEKDWKKKQGYA